MNVNMYTALLGVTKTIIQSISRGFIICVLSITLHYIDHTLYIRYISELACEEYKG
jgi:hypothetical protein